MQGDTMGERMSQKNSERQPGSIFVRGLCAGAMVGAGVALLFTPRTGSQWRERLADSAARAAAAVSSTVEALARCGEDMATQANRTAAQAGQDMARAAEGGNGHVGKGLATLGEITALHGEEWRAVVHS